MFKCCWEHESSLGISVTFNFRGYGCLVEVRQHTLTFTEQSVVSLQLLVLGRQVDRVLHSLQEHTSVSALRHLPLLFTYLTKLSEYLESSETDNTGVNEEGAKDASLCKHI